MAYKDRQVISIVTWSNNNLIATCSDDKTITIWNINISSKKLIERNKNNILLDPKFFFIKELKGHTNDVTTLAYIKERDLLVSASSDNTLRVWSMKIYQLISVIKRFDTSEELWRNKNEYDW